MIQISLRANRASIVVEVNGTKTRCVRPSNVVDVVTTALRGLNRDITSSVAIGVSMAHTARTMSCGQVFSFDIH